MLTYPKAIHLYSKPELAGRHHSAGNALLAIGNALLSLQFASTLQAFHTLAEADLAPRSDCSSTGSSNRDQADERPSHTVSFLLL